MIIDLDAHQGNGHEIDFSNDGTFILSTEYVIQSISNDMLTNFLTGRVYILDMYNSGIYPFVSTATL